MFIAQTLLNKEKNNIIKTITNLCFDLDDLIIDVRDRHYKAYLESLNDANTDKAQDYPFVNQAKSVVKLRVLNLKINFSVCFKGFGPKIA